MLAVWPHRFRPGGAPPRVDADDVGAARRLHAQPARVNLCPECLPKQKRRERLGALGNVLLLGAVGGYFVWLFKYAEQGDGLVPFW